MPLPRSFLRAGPGRKRDPGRTDHDARAAAVGGEAAERGERDQRGRRDRDADRRLRRRQPGNGERQRRPDGEGDRRGQRGLHRAGDVPGGDAQFVADMGAQRIVSHHLGSHLPCQGRLDAAADVDGGELAVFAVAIHAEFVLLALDVGLFRVGLRMHRDVFAGCHRHRAGNQAGHAGEHHGLASGAGGRYADQQAGRRDDAVVRAEYRGAQPAVVVGSMPFVVTPRHLAILAWPRLATLAFMKYLHTMVRVTDVEASLHFYRDALGLELLSRRDVPQGRYTLIFLAAPGDHSAQVELTYNWDPQPYPGGRNFGHLAYQVDDIYAACRRLQEHGVTINRPPREGRMAFVRSPDGISVELLQAGAALPPAEPWVSMPNSGSW